MNAISYLAKFVYAFSKLYFKIKVSYSTPLNDKEIFILASNHISSIDPIILGAVFFRQRKMSFMATKGLFRQPLGFFLKSIGTISVDRKNSSHKDTLFKAIETLKIKPLLIFPSGGRNSNNVKGGLGFIAFKANVPVYPVCIVGTHEALPKGSFFPRPKKIHVEVGLPIFPEQWLKTQNDINKDDFYLSFSKAVMNEINVLKSNYEAKKN